MIGRALSHAASFLFNYLGRGEFRTATVGGQMFAPYGRVAILHLTIIGGALLGVILGTSLGVLVVLIGLEMAIDVALPLREHRRAVAA